MKLITFDDNYESVYTKAYPYMKARGIRGLVFVIVDLIGKKDRMTLEQLKELQDNGWMIGSHTLSHPNLNKIPLKQAKIEIVESKNKLVEMGFKVSTFAYPYGRWNEDILNIVKKHYKWARAVDSSNGSMWTRLVDDIKIAMIHSIDQPQYPCNMSFRQFTRHCSGCEVISKPDIKDNQILHCFMSWGRKDLTEQGFESLLQSVRKQDKILVIDQEGINRDYFTKHKNKIDFIFYPKLNYEIGPIWIYVKSFLLWMVDTSPVFYFDKDRRWIPDYINIIENDTIGKKGWVDRVLKVFETEGERVGITTGYEAPEHKPIRKKGEILIKNITPGVQIMMQIQDLMNAPRYLKRNRQDASICGWNKDKGKVVGVLPGEIEHTGDGRGRSKE